MNVDTLFIATGWLALVFTVTYKAPQVLKIIQTRKSDDLSMFSFHLHNLSNLLYVVYASRDYASGTVDIVFIISCSSSILYNLGILYLSKKHENLELKLESPI